MLNSRVDWPSLAIGLLASQVLCVKNDVVAYIEGETIPFSIARSLRILPQRKRAAGCYFLFLMQCDKVEFPPQFFRHPELLVDDRE